MGHSVVCMRSRHVCLGTFIDTMYSVELTTAADVMSGTGVVRDWNVVYGHLE